MQDISDAALELGLAGRAVCVHASLRSFGWVDGGAQAVVEGLLAQGCSVMVPTHSYADHALPQDKAGASDKQIFDSRRNLLDLSTMGAIPATVLSMPGRVRGQHALDSFTAIGPRAGELVRGQTYSDVYAPVRELARQEGLIVLMGVGLNKLTAIHQAEKSIGRKLNALWVRGENEQPVLVNVGACSEGFVNLDATLAPIERRLQVGASLWRVFPLKPLLELAAQAMRAQPAITCCPDPDCGHCNSLRRSTGLKKIGTQIHTDER
jgi:aminoglycoside 3-N-acetyltransferase